MKRLVMAGLLAGVVTVALAMPTKDELAKAQPLVTELMAPAMAEFKAKTKTAAEVGEVSAKYAAEAETEAAKFLLLKGAIAFYVRGGEYDKAADTVERMKADVKDVPPSVLAEIISKATARTTGKKAPRLFAQYRQAKAQSAAEADVKGLAAQLKKKPDNLALRRQYAEALAVSGDWKSALDEFAKLNDGTAKMAKAELEGTAKSADLGEFWWTYEPAYENAGETFKAHAAAHYRQALDADEITGLKKNIVNQRLAGIQEISLARPTPLKKPLFAIPKKGRGPDVDLTLGGNEKMTFVSCPAGTFQTVGGSKRGSEWWKHEVTISRPFWFAKHNVTYSQLRTLTGHVPKMGNDDVSPSYKWDVLGGEKTPVGFSYNGALKLIENLNERYRDVLPSDYVFRFPTEAEWERAFVADHGGHWDKKMEKWVVKFEERKAALCDKMKTDYSDKDLKWPWSVPYFAVMSKEPNEWGIYDFLGNGWMYMLDTVDGKSNKLLDVDPAPLGETYEPTSVDPFSVAKGKFPRVLMRGDGWCKRFNGENFPKKALFAINDLFHQDGHLRLVIGPDLIAEKKAAAAKGK